jgi:hypothetical protein
MIAYYPLEDDVPSPPNVPVPVPETPQNSLSKLFVGETTECNYLVFTFIIGVLLLALTDSMRR